MVITLVIGSAAVSFGFELDPPVDLVGAARANQLATPTPTFGALLPIPSDTREPQADRSVLSSRDHQAAAAAPLPTPVPVDSAATPLAAPLETGVAPPVPAPPVTAAPPAAAPPAVAALAFPVPGGSISQPFRPGHEGVDIAAVPGAAVLAAEGGIVVSAGWRNNGGGLVVEIEHGGGLNTVYNHLGSIAVFPGQSVSRGTVVGGMGCSGVCYGPHIQFDVRIGGRLVDPLSLIW